MKKALLVMALVVLGAGTAAAVDVVLRGGTVIQATTYSITGSYLLLVLPDGRQVAYSAADVDLDALRAQEAAARAATQPPQPQPRGDTIAAALAAAGSGSNLTISDGDVEHVAASGPAAATEQKPAGPPPGYQEGGQVGMQSVELHQVEAGVWEVTGEVVNRTTQTVGDIRVQLELFSDTLGTLATADVVATSSLEPNAKASFSHRFQVTADKPPRLRGKVYWMQQEAPATPAGDAGRGGLPQGAAEARPTPIS